MSFFVLSQPDYTVGFEISSNQLALADFTAGQELSQLTLTLPQRHDILSYCELRNVRIISVRSALLNTAEPATKIFAPAAINEAAFCVLHRRRFQSTRSSSCVQLVRLNVLLWQSHKE